MKCIVVEDDPNICTLVCKSLQAEGFLVTKEHNGDLALDLLQRETFDVAVLDIMIPGRDGLSILRRIRNEGNHTPVLLLTARSSLVERVEGLEVGADDYLTKPFHIEELVARAKALARRAKAEIVTTLSFENLIMNLSNREVKRADRSIELSNREFSLLEYFLRNKGRVLSRAQICEHVWGYYFEVNDNLVDVYVKRLRKKLEESESERIIQTVRGIGYSIKEHK